jgi:hypothetical protein
MNTGSESTVWTRFWSWLSPAKTVEVAAPVASAAASEIPAAAASEIPAAAASEIPAAAEVVSAPSEPTPAPPAESGKTLQIPLETKPLDVEATNAEQQSKNDKSEEQPNPSASSAKSQNKKKKRH